MSCRIESLHIDVGRKDQAVTVEWRILNLPKNGVANSGLKTANLRADSYESLSIIFDMAAFCHIYDYRGIVVAAVMVKPVLQVALHSLKASNQ